jgi:V8-like Glu-specific endopeptidase
MPSATTLTEEAFVLTTVRISAGLTNAAPTSVGTGFLYKVSHQTANVAKCLLITNKHVVQNAEVVHFLLSHASSLTDLNEQHQPVGREDESFTVTLGPNLYRHRDDAIDLCAIDVTVPVGNLLTTGRKLRSLILDSSWLPNEVDRKNMRTVEPVMVVGYPRGLFDSHNNMPIVRRGGTATHPLAHYQNRKDFLVDVAAYGGSSGSPVFRFESPFYREPDGTLSPGSKGQFLGVVWGVIETTSQGILHVVEIPSVQSQIPVMQTSLNLAIALHGDLIRDFDDQIFPSGAPFVPLVSWPAGHG